MNECWLYMAVILDLHSHRVIGCPPYRQILPDKIACRAMVSNRMKRNQATRAMNMAIALRRPPKGCIHHTDGSSHDCSRDDQTTLRQHRFQSSKSGTGNCYDNATVETFFKTIKAELMWQRSLHTRRHTEIAILNTSMASTIRDAGIQHLAGKVPWPSKQRPHK